MHPRIHEQMANQRMEDLQREAAAIQRMNRASSDLDNKIGNHSFNHVLRYLLFGLYVPASSQNPGTYSSRQRRYAAELRQIVNDASHLSCASDNLQGVPAAQSGEMQGEGPLREEYTLSKLQARLNATTRVVGLAALGLGLLVGAFLNSRFGLLPIVLLSGIVLVAVSFPILMRSALMLTKHTSHPFDLERALARKSRNKLLPALSSKTSPSTNCGAPMGSLGSHDGSSCDA